MSIKTAKIIAIDGPAASGKGTLARNLAQSLNFAHMDTGALYRAVAYEVLQAAHSPEDEQAALQGCRVLRDKLAGEKISGAVLGNPALRSEEIGQGASKVAGMQSVRDMLTDLQRNFAHHPPTGYAGTILDGRDIGTVICPAAPLKLYVVADPEIRAQRRLKELQSKGLIVTYEAVLEDMRARDARDSGRRTAPLVPADDAVIVDSSHLSEGDMLTVALEYAAKAFG